MFLFGVLIASAMTVKDEAQIEDYIAYVSQKEGINVSLFLGITRAESGFKPNAKNPVSTASGVMQFLDSTFKNYCIKKYKMTDTIADKNHPAIQVNCAAEMLKEPKGYLHWWESSYAWKQFL